MGRTAMPGRHSALWLSAILGIGLALLAIRLFDGATRPLINEMAQTSVKNAVTAIVNDAVSQTLATQAVAYDDLVTMQTDQSGRITAMRTSAAAMNLLRTEILEDVIAQVDLLDSKSLGIPLGTLTGIAAASDRGPVLPVSVLSVASADASFRNAFTASGINQTLHRIMLDVTVDVKLLVPGGTLSTSVAVQVSLAETVIVGQVPEAYLQLGS